MKVHEPHDGECYPDLYLPPRMVLKLRIVRDDSHEYPWQVDGIDGRAHYTEEVWNFRTFQEAVAALSSIAGHILVLGLGGTA